MRNFVCSLLLSSMCAGSVHAKISDNSTDYVDTELHDEHKKEDALSPFVVVGVITVPVILGITLGGVWNLVRQPTREEVQKLTGGIRLEGYNVVVKVEDSSV